MEIVYVSRMMKAKEVREACQMFRNQNARIQRQKFHVIKKCC